jgi:hypothetical protein
MKSNSPLAALLKQWRGSILATTLAMIVLASSSLAAIDASTGPFPNTALIETSLQRGTSTKSDVQRLLGTPEGFGEAVLPPSHENQEIWYYEDLEVKDFQSEGQGVLRGNLKQQVLVIFFQENRFNGYMWFTNAHQVESK